MTGRHIRDMIGNRDLLEMPATAMVREAAKAMRDWSVGAVLVTDETRLQGIFTERDLLNRVVAEDKDPDSTPLADVMTKNPDTIAPDTSTLDALRLMDDGGYRHLPVVSSGRVVGIVSRRDFFAWEQARLESETGLWERL